MNYQKHYNLLIESNLSAQQQRVELKKSRGKQELKDRINETYFENHHIIPKCLGGTNDKYNLILLTPREHYIAHWLLTKIYPSEWKLGYALFKLSTDKQNNHVNHNSRKYELLRNEYSKSQSMRPVSSETRAKISKAHKGRVLTEIHKARISKSNKGKKLSDETKEKIRQSNIIAMSGKNNPFYGKTHSDETKEKIRISRLNTKHTYETKAKISKSLIGRQSGPGNGMFNKNHSLETKEKMKNTKLKQHGWLKGNNSKIKWIKLYEIFKIWDTYNKPNNKDLIKLCLNIIPKTSNGNIMSLQVCINWFILYGNPINNDDWLKFISNNPE